MKKVNIIIVEDEMIVAETLRRILIELEYTIYTIISYGEELIINLKNNQTNIDLILMDISLKGEMTGIQTAEFIKDEYDIPIIFITAFSDDYTFNQAKSVEPYGYIVKPFRRIEIKSTIELTLYRTKADKKIKEKQQQIIRQNDFLENILESISDPFYVIDANTYQVCMANSAAKSKGNYHQRIRCYELIHGKNIICSCKDCICPLFEVKKQKQRVSVEHAHRDKNGNYKIFEIHGFPVFNKNGNVTQVIEYSLDITERKRLEKQVLEISEREQQRIGYNIHDGLSQQLTGIAFLAESLRDDLQQKKLVEQKQAADIVDKVNNAISYSKKLASELYPINLKNICFFESVHNYINQTSKMYHIAINFNHSANIFIRNKSMASHLYRIVQEAVINAIKHSRADEIDINFSKKNGLISLTIKDNGVGISDIQCNKNGMGISLMKYRASMINGSFQIAKHNKGGTQVMCNFKNRDNYDESKIC